MTRNTKSYHLIKDPVLGSMQFTDEENNWIKPFIDSPNFQRLRHIKQLGMGDLIFPGAVHTRFNHALGCSYIAGQIASKLELPSQEKKIVMIAGLLHDIGHGPFSHAFEGIFLQGSVKHEDWTGEFLKEYLSDSFVKEFNKRNPHSPLTASELRTIKNLIMHKENKKKLLADIVSSQMDADRLDYLRRDSHFCGVTYGVYDFSWLLHCLTIVKDDQGFKRLGITEKGIGSAEQYLMARRLMMKNVYYNGKKHAAEFLLSAFLRYLSHSLIEKADEELLAPIKSTNLAKFLLAVTELNHKVKEQKGEGNLVKAFLKKNHSIYKKLCDYDVLSMIRYFSGLDSEHPVVQIAKLIQARQLPKAIRIDEKQLVKTRQQIKKEKKAKNIQPWQLAIIELPHQSYLGSQDPIWVKNNSGETKALHDNSVVISGLSDVKENVNFLIVDRAISLTGF
jgi:HD superfamily phosphohydrolase